MPVFLGWVCMLMASTTTTTTRAVRNPYRQPRPRRTPQRRLRRLPTSRNQAPYERRPATVATQTVVGIVVAVITFVVTFTIINSVLYVQRNGHRLSVENASGDLQLLLQHPYLGLAYQVLTVGMMVKLSLFGLLLLAISVVFLDAFLVEPYHRRGRATRGGRMLWLRASSTPPLVSSSTAGAGLTHEEILWKMRPPPETSMFRKFMLRFGANIIRVDAMLKGQEPPFCLCPKGGQCVLEAHYKVPGSSKQIKIGRFGITSIRGPPAPEIDETARELFDGQAWRQASVGTAAIIYMFVEPDYRKRNVGALALEIISAIHSNQGVDFTILVADDNGSGKLIEWYEQYGFKRAPKLQSLLGSANKEYGVAMMAPTDRRISAAVKLKWW